MSTDAIAALARRDLDAVEAALDVLRSRGHEVVPQLREAYADAVNVRQRQALVRLAGELGEAGDVPWVIARAGDGIGEVVVEWALLELGPVAVEALRAVVAPPSVGFAPPLARALAVLAPPDAAWLRDQLEAIAPSRDDDAVYGWLCAQVAERHAAHDGLRAVLRRHATHGGAEHRLDALEALARLGLDDGALVDHVERLLPLGSWHALSRLERVLLGLRDPAARERAWLRLRRWQVPHHVQSALVRVRSRTGDPQASEALVDALLDPVRAYVPTHDVTTHPPSDWIRDRLRERAATVAPQARLRLQMGLAAHGDEEAAESLLARVATIEEPFQREQILALLRDRAPHLLERLVGVLGLAHDAIARFVLQDLAARDALQSATREALRVHWGEVRTEVARGGDRLARRELEDASLALLAHARAPLEPGLAQALDDHLANQARVLREHQRRFVHTGVLDVELLEKSTWLGQALETLPRRIEVFDTAERALLGARLTALTTVLDDYARQLPRHHDGRSKLVAHHRAAVRAALVFGHHPWLEHLPEPLRRNPTDRLDATIRELARRNVLAATLTREAP